MCNSKLKNRIITTFLIFLISANLNAINSGFYAGIEVGSKGVKLCIVDPKIISLDLSKKIIFETTITSDYIKFTLENEELTALAVYNLYYYAYEKYDIPDSQIFLAISSGVNQIAIKEGKVNMITHLKSKIKSLLQDNNRDIEVISVEKESILTFKSIVPEDKNNYMKTIVIDIGSGNTKGGYFISKNVFNTFNLGWASNIYTHVERQCDTNRDIFNFKKELEKTLDQIGKNELASAIDKCGITKYNFNIIFSGGIVWADATLMKPDLLDDTKIETTYKEVSNYYLQIFKNYSDYTSIEKSKEYKLERNKIEKIFSQRRLIAGTGLLLEIMKKFQTDGKNKKFTLIKNNKSGWLPAYILENIKQRQTNNN